MIRKIKRQDYHALQKLTCQLHDLHCQNRPDIYGDGNPLPLENFEKMLNDENAFNCVYEEDGKICGLLLAVKRHIPDAPVTRERNVYFIDAIVVDKDCRKRGIGKALCTALKEQALKEQMDAIELNVWAFNESAVRLYTSLGMKVQRMKMELPLKNI